LHSFTLSFFAFLSLIPFFFLFLNSFSPSPVAFGRSPAQITLVEVKRRIIRTLLVALSWGVAVGIPVFQLCLSLIGGLSA
jgi:ABC-type glycerol-3-phosphate transport system permease component